jgi:type IV pilus biogenesis protein CpaD/CtpE
MSAVAKAAVVMVAATMLCGGCAQKNTGPGGANDAGSDAPVLVVENNKWLDVNVFAVRNGTRHRLGSVTSLQTERFRLPSWTTVGAAELRLLIDPVGSEQVHLTEPILVSTGSSIVFKVADYLPLSAYSVLAAERR